VIRGLIGDGLASLGLVGGPQRSTTAISGSAAVKTDCPERPWVMLIARIAAPAMDKEEIEAALGGLFEMSAIYDQ
jgi:hypothetical protein